FIIIIISIILFIINFNPSKWNTGVVAHLKEATEKEMTTYIGVIDRFVNEKAVILIENERKEIVMHKSDLPRDCREGTWLLISEHLDGSFTAIIQDELTNKNKKESKRLIEHLKNKKDPSLIKDKKWE